MNPHVGRRPVHVGPAPLRVAETVARGILDAPGGEFQALQRALLRGDVDPDASFDGKVLRPVDRLRRCIDVVLVAVVELADAPEDARGDPRPEVGAVADLPTT